MTTADGKKDTKVRRCCTTCSQFCYNATQRDCRVPVWRLVAEKDSDRGSLARHPDLYVDTCRSECEITNVCVVQIAITCSSIMRQAISEMQHVAAELTVHQVRHSAVLWTNSPVETESYEKNLWDSINNFTVRWTKLACGKVDVCSGLGHAFIS